MDVGRVVRIAIGLWPAVNLACLALVLKPLSRLRQNYPVRREPGTLQLAERYSDRHPVTPDPALHP